MKQPIRLLNLTTGSSVSLLTLAGMLIVVSIFNESLDWDIFGPKVEAILYGVFGSSIALASVGVAMTFVLGIRDITKMFRAIQYQKTATEKWQTLEAPKSKYILCLFYILLLFTLIISSLALINKGVQEHRSRVFKRLVTEQMEHFQPKLYKLIEPISTPPRQNVSFDLYDLLNTLNNLSYIDSTTLFLPDPEDYAAIWAYKLRLKEYERTYGFRRFFVAKSYEKAIAKGIAGNEDDLIQLNEKVGFIWYYLLKDKHGKAVAVLRIHGNSRENFREYLLGS